jgi:hypothetical protein
LKPRATPRQHLVTLLKLAHDESKTRRPDVAFAQDFTMAG